MDSLLSTIPKVFHGVDTDTATTQALVFAAWARVAGEGIRKNALPLEIVNAKLVIAVRDTSWSINLTSLAPQLIARLSGELGKGVVKYLEFKTKPPLFGSNISPETADADPNALDPQLVKAAGAITDPKLRRSFLTAAAAYLGQRTPAK